MPASRGGRPSDINEEKIGQAGKLAAICLSHKAIADILGISEFTFYGWKKRGQAALDAGEKAAPGEEPFVQFLTALNEGYAKAEKTIVQGILACLLAGQWGAGKFLLTSHPRFRKSWKEKELSIDDALKVIAGAITAGDQEVVQQLKTAVDQAARVPSA